MKTLTSAILVLFSLLSSAQTSGDNKSSFKMLEGNPVWEYCTNYWLSIAPPLNQVLEMDVRDGITFCYYYLNGTEVVNGKEYRRLWKYIPHQHTYKKDYPKSNEYVMKIREENGRVYFLREEYEKVFQWYFQFAKEEGVEDTPEDYYQNVGDGEMLLVDFSWNTVDSVEMTDGSFRGLIHGNKTQYIDGVGGINRFFIPPEIFSDSRSYCLNRFYQNGKVVYQAPPFDPRPTEEDLADVKEIDYNAYLSLLRFTEFSRPYTFKESPFFEAFTTGLNGTESVKRLNLESAPIFDLQGRQLSHKPEKGLYIQNGKVRIAR